MQPVGRQPAAPSPGRVQLVGRYRRDIVIGIGMGLGCPLGAAAGLP
jgi:hypothetical protein